MTHHLNYKSSENELFLIMHLSTIVGYLYFSTTSSTYFHSNTQHKKNTELFKVKRFIYYDESRHINMSNSLCIG